MAEPIKTAGRAMPAPQANPRKDALRLIGRTLRKQDATEDEVTDALEALAELTKD